MNVRMMLVVLLLSLGLTGSLRAQVAAPQSADNSALQLLGQKLKEARPAVLLSPYMKPAYEAFLPVWTFHAKYDIGADGKPVVDMYKQFVSCGVGGKFDMTTRAGSGFGGVQVNLVALSTRAWDTVWARDHVDRSKFPPIWAGPALEVPDSAAQIKTMNLKRDLRGQISIAVLTY